jgi:alpha-L-rhamnosidase
MGVTESGKPVAKATGVKFLRQENDKLVYEVGSGTYKFATDLK